MSTNSHGGLSWYQYFNYALQQQARQLRMMEQKISELEQTVDALRKQKAIHIDSIEYRFDQLKVERLDGTLNIGFTPGSGGDVEDVPINQTPDEPVGGDFLEPQYLFGRIRGRMHTFLDEEAMKEIRKLEEQYRTVLGEEYRRQMIEDLRKQIDKRIGYYMNQLGITPENMDAREKEIYERTKTDVVQAIERHIRQLKGVGQSGAVSSDEP